MDEEEPGAIEPEESLKPPTVPSRMPASDLGELNQAINNLINKQRVILRPSEKSDNLVKAPIADDNDIPPAIEPRKEHPPAPPPRPRKPSELSPQTPIMKSSLEVPKQQQESPLSKQYGSMKNLPEEQLEALELLTPLKTKSLTLKKKNSILAKRRKVTVKSLQHSDIQGHLYRRTKDKNGLSYWAKGYFVLVDNALYFFRLKDSIKADFLSFLTGFTVSLATEIRSKPFAFKVYHAIKSLYFAAETQEALSQWMEYLRQATVVKGLSLPSAVPPREITEIKEIFSETESSEEETESTDVGSGSSHQKSSITEPSESLTVKYHLGLGSLKKFTKSNPFSSNRGDKKPSSDIPIPTAQFRSYKKVQGFAGISIGNHFFPPEVPLRDLEDRNKVNAIVPSTPPFPLNNQPPVTPLSIAIPLKQELNVIPKVAEKVEPVIVPKHCNVEEAETPEVNRKRSRKPQPHNYIHASNPNLVDFECHITSKTIEFGNSKLNSTWDSNATANAGTHSLQVEFAYS